MKYYSVKLYYMCVFLWSMFYTISHWSNIGKVVDVSIVFKILFTVLHIPLVWKVLLDLNREKIQSWIKIGLLLALSIIAFRINGFAVYSVFLFLAASKNVDIRIIMKNVLAAQIFAFILIVFAFGFGLINEELSYRLVEHGYMERHSLGFKNCNTLGGCLLQMYLLAFGLYSSHNRLLFLCISVISIIGCLFVANSLSPTAIILMCSILYLINISIGNFNRKIFTVLKQVSAFIPYLFLGIVMLSVLSAFGIIQPYSEMPIVSTLILRISLAAGYYARYGLSLFGQKIEMHNNYDMGIYGISTLDNGFVNLLLVNGMLVFLFYIAMSFFTIRKLINDNEIKLAIIMLFFAIYGFMESLYTQLLFNFSLLFWSILIWKNDIRARSN